jgi:hypothetical protein
MAKKTPASKQLKDASNDASSSTQNVHQLKKQVAEARNPPTPYASLEFMGPIGAAGVIFGLPIVEYLLYLSCNSNGCVFFYPSLYTQPLLTSLKQLNDIDLINW